MILWVNNGDQSTVYDTIATGHYLNLTTISPQISTTMQKDEVTGNILFKTTRKLDP